MRWAILATSIYIGHRERGLYEELLAESDKIQRGPEPSVDDPEKVRGQGAEPAGELFPIQRGDLMTKGDA